MFTQMVKNNFKQSGYTKFDIDLIEENQKHVVFNEPKTKVISESQTDSPIGDFYSDQTIFITGATGFLGTLLVEKLLRCCPKIRKLILLVRGGKSSTVNERAREYFNDPVFDTMRLSNTNYAEKVDFACGQLEADDLGLSPNDLELLVSNTTVVFHVAATVRFDEHLRVAYEINVKGTQTLISLAKKMPNLKCFMHVSTAYCHCDRKFIEEKFYPPVFTADEMSILMDSTTDTEMAILNEHLLGEKPNSYTLTKSIAEDLVRDIAHELPICVFRPSVVLPTLQEPMPNWMKGFNSVLALSLLSGIGLSRVQLTDPKITVDIVPADLTVNAMAALAWFKTTHQKKADPNIVYNFVSCQDNKIGPQEIAEKFDKTFASSGESFNSVIWQRGFYLTNSPRLYSILFYVFHFLPAVVFSLAEKLTHQKPKVLKIYRRMISLSKALEYFSLNEWNFENGNMKSIVNAMSAEDQIQYNTLLSTFSWDTMFSSLHRAVPLYVLNERVTKEQYEKKGIYLYWAHNCLCFVAKITALYLFLHCLANAINSYGTPN